MDNAARNLSLDELRLVLQNQYRRFIAGVTINHYADGRPFVTIRFADSGANDDNHNETSLAGGA